MICRSQSCDFQSDILQLESPFEELRDVLYFVERNRVLVERMMRLKVNTLVGQEDYSFHLDHGQDLTHCKLTICLFSF
jgi:hypothetical protein